MRAIHCRSEYTFSFLEYDFASFRVMIDDS